MHSLPKNWFSFPNKTFSIELSWFCAKLKARSKLTQLNPIAYGSLPAILTRPG